MVTGFGGWRINPSKEVAGDIGISFCCSSEVEVWHILDQVFEGFGRLGTSSCLSIDVQGECFLGVRRGVKADVDALFCGDLWSVIDVCE